MAHHVAVQAPLTPTGTIAAATLATTPPAEGDMLDLAAHLEKAPPYLVVEVYGSTADQRLLSGAVWWGKSRTTGKLCRIGPAFNGVDVTISNARSAADVLELAANLYSKIGITGTLAADGLVLAAAVVESRP